MKLCILVIGAAAALAGCDKAETGKMTPATRDLGTGLNTVERTYARPPADMVPVVQRVLLALDLKIESETHDNLGGQAVAVRATGQKVTVTTKGLEPNLCSLAVRVEPGDRNLANLIQDRIADALLPVGEKSRQP